MNKAQKILDKLTGCFVAICMLYGISPENPAYKDFKKLLKELEEYWMDKKLKTIEELVKKDI